MARAFQVSETIDRPIEAVWDFLSDLNKIPLWMAGIESARLLTSGPPEEGARISLKAQSRELEDTIVRFEPPNVFALSCQQKGIFAVYTYTCIADGDRTRVTLQAECFAEKLIWKLLHPLIGFLMKQADGGQLKSLKRAIEETGS